MTPVFHFHSTLFLPTHIQKYRLSVNIQHHRVRRYKHTISLIEIDCFLPIRYGSAPIHAQKHTETDFVRLVAHHLSALRIHKHTIYLEIFAPTK